MTNRPTAQQLNAEIKRLRSRRRFARALRNTFISLIVVAALALGFCYFCPVMRVTSASMVPTLKQDDILVSTRQSSVERGDVAAFYYNDKMLVKRVIALGGDTVNIAEDGTVSVNDTVLDESYVSALSFDPCTIEMPCQVPEGFMFVLGDNRALSIDSRSDAMGMISQEQLLGKVLVRIWPFDSFTVYQQ